MTTSLAELIEVGADLARELAVECAVIGACARNVYAPPRATRDLDLTMAADGATYARVVEFLSSRGFLPGVVVRDDPDDPQPDVALFRDSSGARIDLLFAKTDFEREALARRRAGVEALGGLPVITVEDLIVFKLIAARPKDLIDAEDVVRTQEGGGRSIDWSHVERWSIAWDLGERLTALRAALE